MNNTSKIAYPKIHLRASRSSDFYQKSNYALILTNLIVLVLAAGVDSFKPESLNDYYPKTLLLILSLCLAILINRMSLGKKWHASRSLSETIKTLTWRFKMGAAPFDSSNSLRGALFLERLEQACLESNKLIGFNKFAIQNDDLEFSSLEIFNPSLEENIATYITHRANNQLRWYTQKAQRNEHMSKAFFFLFIICNTGAMGCSAWQETVGDLQISLTGLLIAFSTAIIGWVEARKYNELSAAYLMTRNEISLLVLDMHNISTPSELASFVTEAESLFSREHTQWAAKRGYVKMEQGQ